MRTTSEIAAAFAVKALAAVDIGRELGLSFGDIDFSIMPVAEIDRRASFRNRYQHWSLWDEWARRKTEHDQRRLILHEHMGFGQVMEGFLPSDDPQILHLYQVVHYLGHADFYSNNEYFLSRGDTDLDLQFGLNRGRIRGYEDDLKIGKDRVKQCLNAAYSLVPFVDPGTPLVTTALEYRQNNEGIFRQGLERRRKRLERERPYQDLDSQEERQAQETATLLAKAELVQLKAGFPQQPQPDLMLFIAVNSPALEDWQRDILLMIRDETIALLPETRTKIVAHGWANLWTPRILREMGDREVITKREAELWPDLHGEVIAPRKGSFDWIGLYVFEDIERRIKGKSRLDGRREINWLGEIKPPLCASSFEIRDGEDDTSFLRRFMTPELLRELMKDYKIQISRGSNLLADPQVARDTIVTSLTDTKPLIQVAVNGGNLNNNSELLLAHAWQGQYLDKEQVQLTLQAVRSLWGRPVHLETTQLDDQGGIWKVRLDCLDEKGILTELLYMRE